MSIKKEKRRVTQKLSVRQYRMIDSVLNYQYIIGFPIITDVLCFYSSLAAFLKEKKNKNMFAVQYQRHGCCFAESVA